MFICMNHNVCRAVKVLLLPFRISIKVLCHLDQCLIMTFDNFNYDFVIIIYSELPSLLVGNTLSFKHLKLCIYLQYLQSTLL